jgi:hypothetical protein
MSVLPFEDNFIAALNVFMLSLVAIVPYLFRKMKLPTSFA